MISIYSYNLNGFRAAVRKGFLQWIKNVCPDIICLQEIKATAEQLPIDELETLGYNVYLNSAEKKGYSGVAILSRIPAVHVDVILNHHVLNSEGRTLVLDFGTFALCSAYFPSGTSPERQCLKMAFLDAFSQMISKVQLPLIIAGDFNICHQKIDIHDPERKAKTPGFLPEERAWMDAFFMRGFEDGVRMHNPYGNLYSWWSYRTNARERNKGWRIDYIAVPSKLKTRVKTSGHDLLATHSDHCPIWVSMDIEQLEIVK